MIGTRVKLSDLSPEASKQVRRAIGAPVFAKSQKSSSKWRNVRVTLDGIRFASQREAQRYAELKIELRAGMIGDLELQKRFPLMVNGVHVCAYVADLVYCRQGVRVVEDAKGKATDVYKIKRALMRAVYGIEIVEV